MKASEYSDEKCAQILADVEIWVQGCQKHFEYKFLSRDAKKNLGNIISFFAEMMYMYHRQSPEQWTKTALHNILTDVYTHNLLVQVSYYKAVGPVLAVFFKYLQSVNVISADKAQVLEGQLKISVAEMLHHYNDQSVVVQTNQLLNAVSNLKRDFNNTTDVIEEDVSNVYDASKPIEMEQTWHSKKIGRNEPCPCGSGEKYKKCCLLNPLDTDTSEIVKQSKSKLSRGKREPTQEQWSQLYNVAKDIKRLAPWNFLRETDLITIILPWQKEPVYCSVIGNGGECFGVGAYPGYEGISSFYSMLNTPEDKVDYLLGLEQKCLMCYFGNSDELESKDREVLKKLNLRFRGRNEWIYFRSMEPGYFPWYLNSEQANLMTQILQNFFMACTHLEKLKVNFDDNQTLLRFYSTEKKVWMNSAVKMPPIPEIKRQLIVDDDKLLSKLKKKKCNNEKLEFESMYLPVPFLTNKKDRPRLPSFILLVDKTSETIIDQYVSEDEDPETSILEMFIYYITQSGRPLSIHVRDNRAGCYIADFCKKTGIELIEGKGVPTIDKTLKNLINSITSELLKEKP
jgi:hypothetical protein